MRPLARLGPGLAYATRATAHCRRTCVTGAIKVKVCGVTNAGDADVAAGEGADFVGMILWPKAPRSVSDETAKAIAGAAAKHGVQAVGVFVDEDAATITRRCRALGVAFVQLHGDKARKALFDLPPDIKVIYVVHAQPDGEVVTPWPNELAQQLGREPRAVDWVLVDSLKGGSGVAFDWRRVRVDSGIAREGWLLAGGLNSHNVAEAVVLARPSGVDVSSGVCGPDKLRKDHESVRNYVRNARAALS